MTGATYARLAYRPELDGLRAIAVLLVVGLHLELPWLPWGGYVGVTLFFVLSGYLITSILLAERESTGGVGLRDFYGRRARRLLPALAVILLVAAALTALTTVGRWTDIAAVAFYVSNWVRVAGGDLGWMPQAWSLSVEEQFYLVWPVVLVLAPRRLALVALLAIIAATLFRTTASNGELAYGTIARGDAILYGCLLALVRLPAGRAWPVATAILALVTVSASFPGLSALGGVVVAGCAAIVVLGADRIPGLAWRPLVEIGRRSYGIYLWHMLPVLVLRPFLPNPVAIVAVLAYTAVASWASYRWIERPVMKGRIRRAQAPAPIVARL